MSPLRLTYLALTVLGAVWSGMEIWPDITGAVGGARFAATGALVVAELALAIWCIAEVYVRKNWTALVALPVAWVLGLGCGLPLYLFLRTARVR